MGNGRDYRARAEEFAQLAERTADPELATIYRQLALAYRRLAEWAEHRRAPEPG